MQNTYWYASEGEYEALGTGKILKEGAWAENICSRKLTKESSLEDVFELSKEFGDRIDKIILPEEAESSFDTDDLIVIVNGIEIKSYDPKLEYINLEALLHHYTSLYFDEALSYLKEGFRITRWPDQWICLGEGRDGFWNKHTRAKNNGGSAKVEPYILHKTKDDTVQMGWTPTQKDLLAEDWMVKS